VTTNQAGSLARTGRTGRHACIERKKRAPRHEDALKAHVAVSDENETKRESRGTDRGQRDPSRVWQPSAPHLTSLVSLHAVRVADSRDFNNQCHICH
jgi:hypothetical protein